MRLLRLVAPIWALVLVVGAAAAQQPQQPQCRLSYRGNFRLNGAQQYLDNAQRTRFDDDRQRHVGNALRVLTEAAGAGGADQLTLWYFFGQAYLYRHDLVAADSSFTRAEARADADCRRAIDRLRRNEYVPLQNAAVEQINAQQHDSALALLRRAHVIYRSEPSGYTNMAGVFAQQDNTDSAVIYYRLAAAAGNDPQRDNLRATALFNAARLLHRANRFAEADSAYRDYLRRKPRDMEALTSLASVLTSLNRTQEAGEIYDSLLAHPDSLGPFELFETGVALFRQNRFPLAARAFELGLERNPHYRDALFNLVNTYVASNDTAHLLPAAKRLVAEDPMNRNAIRLLASAYQRAGAGSRVQDSILRSRRDTSAARFRRIYQAYADSTLRALQQHDSLPWEINIVRFEPRDTTAAIRGQVQNLQTGQQRGFTLTLEFVNGAGDVVTREVVEIPDLGPLGEPGNSYDFNIIASGRGILAYRYRTD